MFLDVKRIEIRLSRPISHDRKEKDMKEITTVSVNETEREIGGDIGCMLGCGTLCVLTYMTGAAMAVVLVDF